MASCLIVADRSVERVVNCQTYGKVTVGNSNGVRGIVNGTAITLFIEARMGNGLYYPIVRVHFEDIQAHALAEQLETAALALRLGHTPKTKGM